MPNAKLVQLGAEHPYPERGVVYPRDGRPTHTLPTLLPPAPAPTLDAYLSNVPAATAPTPTAPHLKGVKIRPTQFIVNQAWNNTALKPAMKGHTLSLPQITPTMFATLSRDERTALMDSLSRDAV